MVLMYVTTGILFFYTDLILFFISLSSASLDYGKKSALGLLGEHS